MAGFEVVVRPAIFPDIRPRAKQSLPPQDDPEKGFAEIKGNPGKVISLSDSLSISSSYSRPTETERRVDDVRVYQQDDDGTVNRDNFVDLKVANRISMNEGGGDDGFTVPGDAPGVQRSKTEQGKVYYYKPVEESDNIEIKRKNIIEKPGED